MTDMLIQGHSGVAGGGKVDFTDNPGELLQASPSIVLADHGPQADTGRVLSVAPLMGATAASDAGHARWLHVKVRPPARGLIKAARVTHQSLPCHRMVILSCQMCVTSHFRCVYHILRQHSLGLSKLNCCTDIYKAEGSQALFWPFVHMPSCRGRTLTSCWLMQNTSIGSMRNQMQKQLVDGHWILAFRDAAAAQQAARMVTELSANLRQHLADVMAPFIRGDDAVGGSEG